MWPQKSVRPQVIVESKNLINKPCRFQNERNFMWDGIVVAVIQPGLFVLDTGIVVLGRWLREVDGKPVKVSVFK